MAKYCPECGGELRYDPQHKVYSCLSCGLTFHHQELIEAWNTARNEDSDEERKKQERRDYLKWWLRSRDEKKRG
ncbi:MAG: hypothetical protein QW587_01120 [Candidatus Bathyarchaeia archaeon]